MTAIRPPRTSFHRAGFGKCGRRSKRVRTSWARPSSRQRRARPKRSVSRSPGRTAKATSCSTSRTSARSRSAVPSMPERRRHPSRRPIFTCRPATPPRKPVRQTHRLDAGPARLPAAGHRRRGAARCSASTTSAGPAGASTPASKRRCRRCSSARRSSIVSRPIRPTAARRRLSHQRSRAGLAAVVLPVEQHSRRRPAGRGGARPAEGSGELDRQVRRMLKDPRSAALATNFAAQWLRLAQRRRGATPDDVIFPNFSENLRSDFVKETELFIQSIVQNNGSLTGAADRRLHVRQRAARQVLRRAGRLRQRVPPRPDPRRAPPRPARTGEHPDRDVVLRPHLTGRPRQVDSRERPGHAAAAAAAQRAGAQGERRRRQVCRCASA